MKLNRHVSQICIVVINGLFLLAGGTGLVAGLVIHVDPALVRSFLASHHVHPQKADPSMGFVVSVTSLICVTISVVGSIGALCKLNGILALYAFSLVVVMSTEIAGAIFLGTSSGNSSVYLKESLGFLIRGYNETEDARGSTTSAVRILFSVFSCCGVTGPDDFNGTGFQWTRDPTLRPSNASASLPLACCVDATVSRDVTPSVIAANVSTAAGNFSACLGNVTETSAFFRGCLPAIEELINLYSDYIIVFGAVALVLQVIMIYLSARQCLFGKRKLIYEQISITHPLFHYVVPEPKTAISTLTALLPSSTVAISSVSARTESAGTTATTLDASRVTFTTGSSAAGSSLSELTWPTQAAAQGIPYGGTAALPPPVNFLSGQFSISSASSSSSS